MRNRLFPRTARINRHLSVAALAFVSILIGTSAAPSFAFPQERNSESIKKLIKQAAKSIRRGELESAEATLREAVRLEATGQAAKIELAFVLAKQRSLLESYELGVEACKSEPNNSRAFAVLGTTMLAGGRFAEAREIFIKALNLDRRDHLARAGFGLLNFYENNVAAGLYNLRQSVLSRPQEPDYLFALGQVAARAEQFREAADAYQSFLDYSDVADRDRRERINGLIRFLKYLGHTVGLYRIVGKERTAINFELVENRPVLNVRVNGGKEPLRFVLDTGSSMTVVSQEAAKRFGIRQVARGGSGKGLGGDGKFDIVYGFLRELSIGEVGLRNVPVYIRKFHQGNNQFDGYIGLALISRFLTTIDYGNSTFSLMQKTAVAGPTVVQAADISIPLRLTSSGFLSGEVLLQGVDEPLNFILDTGAGISVISNWVARTAHISPYIKKQTLKVIGSAGITDERPTFLLPKVSFGKNSRKDILAVALDLGIINEASGFDQAGILGGNFLRNYRLTFDFENSVVTFTPVRPEND